MCYIPAHSPIISWYAEHYYKFGYQCAVDSMRSGIVVIGGTDYCIRALYSVAAESIYSVIDRWPGDRYRGYIQHSVAMLVRLPTGLLATFIRYRIYQIFGSFVPHRFTKVVVYLMST